MAIVYQTKKNTSQEKLDYRSPEINEKIKADPSVNVMIPRAKYIHPTILHQAITFRKIDKPKRAISVINKSVRESATEATVGALVSAGFEVSTIVHNQATPTTPEAVSYHQNHISHSNTNTILRTDEYVLENFNIIFHVYFTHVHHFNLFHLSETHKISFWMENNHTKAT